MISRDSSRWRKVISTRDLRSARPPVEGTVARGQLHEDTYFYTGKVGNHPGDYMPFPVTKDVLARGQRELQYLLRAMPLAYWGWQWHDRAARLPRAAFVSHRSSAQSAAGIFL